MAPLLRNLSAKEFRFLRKYLDLSQVELALLVKVSESTVRNWENGRIDKIPGPAESLIRTLVHENRHGDGEVRALLDRISKINKDGYHDRFEMEKKETGWGIAA